MREESWSRLHGVEPSHDCFLRLAQLIFFLLGYGFPLGLQIPIGSWVRCPILILSRVLLLGLLAEARFSVFWSRAICSFFLVVLARVLISILVGSPVSVI